jgi:hypothetical protein
VDNLNWDVTEEDLNLISQIVERAKSHFRNVDTLQLSMDLTAVHLNYCPLNLQGLLQARKMDFCHDISGISVYINRDTGQLEDCFIPRFAQQETMEVSK